jgi:hypothetical protein
VVFAVAGQSVTEGGQAVTVWTLEVNTVEVVYSCPEPEPLLDPEPEPEPEIELESDSELELDPESLPDALVESPDCPGLDPKRPGVVGEDKRAVVQGHTVCQLVLVKVMTLAVETLARSKVLVKKERVNRMPGGYGGRNKCN